MTVSEQAQCVHDWRHIETVQNVITSGYGSYSRDDVFHCTKCAEITVKELRLYCKSGVPMDLSLLWPIVMSR